MWEDPAGHSLFGLVLGKALGYSAWSLPDIKRRSIANGLSTAAVIMCLALWGELVFPPMAMLRACCDEVSWIVGRLLVAMLGLPVGFPLGYFLTRRSLRRAAARESGGLECSDFSEEERSVKLTADPVKRRAKWLTALYVAAVGGVICYAQWFLAPLPRLGGE